MNKHRLFFLGVLLLTACSSGPNRPILFENYRFSATKDQTEVEATVFFRESPYDATENIEPMEVRLNGALFERTQPPAGVSGTFTNLLAKGSVPDPDQPVDGFAIFRPSFSPSNRLTVVGPNGDTRELNLDFSPLEFVASDKVILSRSRDNLVRIVGGKGGRNLSALIGFGSESGQYDKDLVKVELETLVISIPARAIASLKNGPARLYMISGVHDYIDEPFVENGRASVIKYISSYRIDYSTETAALIID
jgi:hypothetical protein